MDGMSIAALFAGLILAVLSGAPVAVCLGLVSLAGILHAVGDWGVTVSLAASTASEALRDYVFAVIPLFMLMGEFVARSGMADDLFNAMNRSLAGLRGRIAYATVLGNVLFAFVSGNSVASATSFTTLAHPQMKRAGYDPSFGLGLIAGSACLGMLIPPSVLMVVWGIITEQSIGALFLAGVVPGMLYAAALIGYIWLAGRLRPELVGERPRRAPRALGAAAADRAPASVETSTPRSGREALSVICVALIMTVSLGGIWFGFVTPTEGAGVGAVAAFLAALARGMRPAGIYEAVLAVGRAGAPILIVLVAAQLYARTLTITGVGPAIEALFVGSGLPGWAILALMFAVWFVLGMVIDSISIMLLTVPLFAPIAMTLGVDPIAFAIAGILAIETGLLTPPFGINVFAIKAVLRDEPISLAAIFRGATPLWIILIGLIVLIMAAPGLVTALPRALF